jgi:kynurenine formamidase
MSIRVIDLSQEMADGMETYPGDALGVRLEHPAHMPQDGYNLSCFTHLACHCGTHIDSPLHFIEHGADLTEIPLRVLPAVIVDTKANPIDFEVFKGLGLLTDRAVLIRTGWDAHLGRPDYYRAAPFLTPEGAEFLAESGIALLGLDSPSPDPFNSTDYPVHHILLGAGIPIVEGLVRLEEAIAEGGTPYFLAFPLRVKGVEGSPVRAAAVFFRMRSHLGGEILQGRSTDEFTQD